MKIISIFGIFLFFSSIDSIVFAQESTNLSSKIIDEKETYLPNLFITVNPIWIENVLDNKRLPDFSPLRDYNPINRGTLCGSASATLFIRKWITLYARIGSTYSKKIVDGYYIDCGSPDFPCSTLNKVFGYFNAESGVGFHLRDTLFQKNEKSFSGKENSSDYDYQKSIAIKKKLIRRIVEARAGAYYYHRTIVDEWDGSLSNSSGFYQTSGSVMSSDGMYWGSFANSITTNPFIIKPGRTNMFVPCIYAGIGMIRQFDRTNKADCDTYKIKGKRKLLSAFADLIIGNPIIADYQGTDGVKHNVSGNGAKGYEKNYLGYRAGIEYSSGKKQAINVRLSYIKKPGLKYFANTNSLFELSFGVCFNRYFLKYAERKKFSS